MPTVIAPGANWHIGAHADDFIAEFTKADVAVDNTTKRISRKFNKAAKDAAVATGSMQTGMRKVQLAAGVAAVGVEDFIQVFPTAGFGGGFRAASNNVSQALFYLLGPMGQFVGVATTLGFILGGSFVEGLMQSKTGIDNLSESAQELKDIFEEISKQKVESGVDVIKFAFELDDINTYEEAVDAVKDKQKELAIAEEESQLAGLEVVGAQTAYTARLQQISEIKARLDEVNELEREERSLARQYSGETNLERLRGLQDEQRELKALIPELEDLLAAEKATMMELQEEAKKSANAVGGISTEFDTLKDRMDALRAEGFNLFKEELRMQFETDPLVRSLDAIDKKYKDTLGEAAKLFGDSSSEFADVALLLQKAREDARGKVFSDNQDKLDKEREKTAKRFEGFFDKIPGAKADDFGGKVEKIANDALELRADFYKEFTSQADRFAFDQLLSAGVQESTDQLFAKESEKLSKEASRRAGEGAKSTAPIDARSVEGYKQFARVVLGAQSAEAESLKLAEEQTTLQQQMADALQTLVTSQTQAFSFFPIPP